MSNIRFQIYRNLKRLLVAPSNDVKDAPWHFVGIARKGNNEINQMDSGQRSAIIKQIIVVTDFSTFNICLSHQIIPIDCKHKIAIHSEIKWNIVIELAIFYLHRVP